MAIPEQVSAGLQSPVDARQMVPCGAVAIGHISPATPVQYLGGSQGSAVQTTGSAALWAPTLKAEARPALSVALSQVTMALRIEGQS